MDTFKNIFLNPKSYNIIPFDNVYDHDNNIGFFKPHYNNIMSDNKPVASKDQLDDLDTMKSVINDVYNVINKINARFPHPKGSREKSLVITKLQEAVHWVDEDIRLHHKL